MLRKALEALSEYASSRKARVLARLLQRCSQRRIPEEPIQMAREAIRIARATAISHTLRTLRSAISAMMDLGDPHERSKFNREYVALAESLDERIGDACAATCGWSSMRRNSAMRPRWTMPSINAAPLRRHSGFRNTNGVPRRLGAMQATMRGNLNVAAFYDFGSRRSNWRDILRIPTPRGHWQCSARRWRELRGAKDDMRTLARELERSFARLPMADIYLKPYMLTVLMRCGEKPPVGARDAAAVEDHPVRDLGGDL